MKSKGNQRRIMRTSIILAFIFAFGGAPTTQAQTPAPTTPNTFFRGLDISNLSGGPPSRLLGYPSELKILNKTCSKWTYYFEQVEEPGRSLDYPAGTLCVVTYHYRPAGASSADFSPSIGNSAKYRLLRNDNEKDLRHIIHYKRFPY